MKTRIALAFGLAGSLLATSAFAQEGTAAAPKLTAGAQIDLLPVGTLTLDEADEGTAFAYGIGASIDYAITPMISIGFAPRYIANVITDNAQDDADAAAELDLRLRVKAQFPVAPALNAYGFLAPGYSIIMLPDDFEGVDDPAGLVVGFGGGVTYDVAPSFFVNGELGYQIGFQSTSFAGNDVDFTSDYLHIGLGAGTRF
jgi:hypothetical protein